MIIRGIAKLAIKMSLVFDYIQYFEYRKKYSISKTFRFNGSGIKFFGDGEIFIGENSYIGSNSIIQSYKGQKVIIGNNCSISHFFSAYTYNNNPNDIIEEKKTISKLSGDIIIGNNCWIGLGVFIKEGVTIGNNCVIGANSTVVRNVPNNCIIGGNPARIIKYFEGNET